METSLLLDFEKLMMNFKSGSEIDSAQDSPQPPPDQDSLNEQARCFMELTYNPPVRQSVWLVGRSLCHNFSKGWEGRLPCSAPTGALVFSF